MFRGASDSQIQGYPINRSIRGNFGEQISRHPSGIHDPMNLSSVHQTLDCPCTLPLDIFHLGYKFLITPGSPLRIPSAHKLDFSPSNHLVVYVQRMRQIMSRYGGMTWEEAGWIESIQSLLPSREMNIFIFRSVKIDHHSSEFCGR